MPKIIVTKIENVRKTQVVKYEAYIPKNVRNVRKYLNKHLKNNDFDLGKVLSEETIEGDILDEEISKIEIIDPHKHQDVLSHG